MKTTKSNCYSAKWVRGRATAFSVLCLLGLGIEACGSDEDGAPEVEVATDTGIDAGSPASDRDMGVDTGSPDSGLDLGAGESPAFQELYDQGIDKYLGRFSPASVEERGGGVTSYLFSDEDRGPVCFTGSEFRMSTRDGSGDGLMIFLQGGGACGPTNCDAVDTAGSGGIPPFGVLSSSNPANPAARLDVGYLPYCDGSLWSGDRDTDSDDDGVDDRLFRGLQNLSASLDVIESRYPAPSRIFLTGNSAGGFGVHMALPLVRKLYPGVAIELVNDSGPGISTPGSQQALNDYWNAGAFYPASCDTCIGDDGHLTDYHAYQLAEDPDLRMGIMSYKQDGVILERSPLDGPAYEAALLQAMAELRDAYPVRFRSFIADGDGHTFILRDYERVVGGTTVREWIEALLGGGESWVSVIE